MSLFRPLMLIVVCFGCVRSLAANPIFHFSVSQGDGRGLPAIPDVSGAGNNGIADATTRFSSEVPAVGVPSSPGNRSLNGFGQGGVNSGGTAELANTAIADAGGFTMESWFLWLGAGTINSIIDYAGTEKLVLDTSVGAGNEVRMRINSDSSMDSIIGPVNPDQWHYVAAVFDTQGNAVEAGSITGIFRLYLDGTLTHTTGQLTITDFGDSLNRAIGVGKHPLNFELDRFDGLIYEPRVSLGALTRDELLYVVPEPSALLLLVVGGVTLACINPRVVRRSRVSKTRFSVATHSRITASGSSAKSGHFL